MSLSWKREPGGWDIRAIPTTPTLVEAVRRPTSTSVHVIIGPLRVVLDKIRATPR